MTVRMTFTAFELTNLPPSHTQATGSPHSELVAGRQVKFSMAPAASTSISCLSGSDSRRRRTGTPPCSGKSRRGNERSSHG